MPALLSPLNSRHVELGGRMVDFAGWSLPVQFQGIREEAQAVRRSGGVFDISHMGQVFVRSEPGSGKAAQALDRLLTSSVMSLDLGSGQYSLLLNEQGGIIDDLIVYRLADDEYFLVVNASMVGADVQWMSDRMNDGVTLEDSSPEFGGIAVQGPRAADWFAAVQRAAGESSPVPLPDRFRIFELPRSMGRFLVCRTGYTGEDGFELFCPSAFIGLWWDAVVDAGATPCGLGARDILRLEKCYPLNGNDLTPDRTPLACGLKFAVDFSKPDFIGKGALLQQQQDGVTHRLVAVKQTEKSPPPRPGYFILADGEAVGVVTSGGVSATLGCGIALAWIKTGRHTVGTPVSMEIRGRNYACEVVRKPFV